MQSRPSSASNGDFWSALFSPDSIAVIGANETPGSWGSDAIRAAVASREVSQGRRAYAVNPNRPQVMGVPCYKSVLDIPDPVDLAVIVVRAPLVPDVLRQCVQKGVRAAVVISAGFAETDEAGVRLQDEIVRIAHDGNIRLVGPNCIGYADLSSGVSSLGVASRTRPGPMALLSQSGTVSASIIQTAASMGIGLSKFVSTGNEADLHLEDYLEYLADDPQTDVIAAYVEGLRQGRRFFRLAAKTSPRKPIVIIKTGGTGGAGAAARSHTGALAGSDVVYSAAFRQTGVIRVSNEEELCDAVLALLTQPLPRGNRVGILTIGGGFGVMATEACEKEGLSVASLGQQTLDRIDGLLPSRWSHGNPVDMVGVKTMDEFPTIIECLRAMLEDDNLDSVMALVTNRSYAGDRFRDAQLANEQALESLAHTAKRAGKPLLLVRRSMPQALDGGEASSLDRENGTAEYPQPVRAARALGHLLRYRYYLGE